MCLLICAHALKVKRCKKTHACRLLNNACVRADTCVIMCVWRRVCVEAAYHPKPSRLAGRCLVLRGAAPPDSAAAAATPASTRWKGSVPHANSSTPALTSDEAHTHSTLCEQEDMLLHCCYVSTPQISSMNKAHAVSPHYAVSPHWMYASAQQFKQTSRVPHLRNECRVAGNQ